MEIIKAKVKPNSKKFSIRFEKDIVYLSIPEKAEKGKANNYLIKIFSKKGINIEILRGKKGKEKILKSDKDIEYIKKVFEREIFSNKE